MDKKGTPTPFEMIRLSLKEAMLPGNSKLATAEGRLSQNPAYDTLSCT
jgi:hypothetical protein